MARKKLKIARLVNERSRMIVLQERSATLFKKAEEFSILCGVEIAVVVFSVEENQYESVWPSKEKFKQILMKYLDKPLTERLKKLTTHEKYLRKEVDAGMNNLKIIAKKTEEKEMEQLFNQLYAGEKTILELDKRQLIGVHNLAIKMKEKVVERRKQLNVQDQRAQLPVDDPLALRLAPPGSL